MSSNNKGIAIDLSPFLRTYNDGAVQRLIASPFVPPSPQNQKDITISNHVSARLYLPNQPLAIANKLPVLIYYHGGGFCLESAFCAVFHNYVNSIVSNSQSLIAVSVEYRLAPEHPLPAAYEDSWVALDWVCSHANEETVPENKDEWIVEFADFDRVYIGGDSAGGNIVHNMAVRAGMEKEKVRVKGAFLSHPHFWGSKAIGSEVREKREESWLSRVWRVVYPGAPGGDDNVMVSPWAEEEGRRLMALGVARMLVVVSEKDEMRERGVAYVELLKRSGWCGTVELVEYDGEDHCFQLFNPECEKAMDLIRRLVSFIV